MGATEEEKSHGSYVSDNDSDGAGFDEDEHFKDDANKVSQKHQKFIDLEDRDREDMDFPDEVDTPFKEARKRF